MVAYFIKWLNHLPNWDEDKAFVWITFSDEIAIQSKDKFAIYFENTLENQLLEVKDINKGKFNKNEVLFLNWQKVVSRAAETRVLRRPENEQDRKEAGYYFEDFIDNTHKDNREIILIIDEAHTHVTKDLAQQIIDYINPKVIFHMTATPSAESELKSRRINSFIEVPREKVVEQGLIKEKVLVQTEEDLKTFKNNDLDEVLIDLGLKKRKEIVEEYKKLNKAINPLVLIQLPNDDEEFIERGEETKEDIVLRILNSRKVGKAKIARWYQGRGVKHEKPDYIEENNDDHDFLLFKQAAGTGWDCPRAHILIRFREVKSETFDIQTVGRILRMPEPEKKEDFKNSSLIRTGYLFTNYERNKICLKWAELSSNKPDVYFTGIKDNINNISLQSDFISRLEYGDLSNSAKFQISFVKSLNNYFKITLDDISQDKAKGMLAKAGVELKPKLVNQMIVDAKYEDFDQLSYDFNKKGHDIELEMSANDVEKTFNYYCYKLLKEQTENDAKISNIARSWSPLKSSIRVWLKTIMGENSDYYYRVFINDINKEAGSKFRPAITQAIKDYKPILRELINKRKKKIEEKEAPVFTIQKEYSFSEDYEEIKTSLCALNKLYLLKEYPGKENEVKFINYIDKKKKSIEWWFKNGDKGQNYYALKYLKTKENEYHLFYPDWIIRFKDGRVGIFDTKAGDTAMPDGKGYTKDKAVALHYRLKELGKKYIGGIVVFENGIWYYNDSGVYDYCPGKLGKEWKNIDILFN